ncbi:MAG TPA: hypothetical protein VGT05_01910 [Patescibacteria group bacterium]|nr:hypothetical protein [Patescibacteria group bacterium]
MKKQFYSHIVSVESLLIALDELSLTPEEKRNLLEIADDSLYHTILDAILSELSPLDKKTFLLHLAKDNHDEIWKFLHNTVENIETKIKLAADDLTEKLHEDIKEIKKQ